MTAKDTEHNIAVGLAQRVKAADAMLERIYQIAEDLTEITHRSGAGQKARRAGRRICNLIDQVDETLGLDDAD